MADPDTAPSADEAIGHRQEGSSRVRRALIFPALVVVIVAVMGALRISGSSSAVYDEPARPGVLAFLPQSVRSDEFVVRTPFVVGQTETGFAAIQPQGVGDHDLSVLYDIPTDDWSMAFRPNLWAYRVIPVENAFALEWWGAGAVLLLGAYVFLLAITDHLWWSVTGSLLLWGSPFFHWWYLPGNFHAVGLALASAAALLWSLRARRALWSWLLVALGGYLGACWAFVFYPPFQVPAGLVVGAATLGVLVAWVRDGRAMWHQVVVRVAAAAVVAGGAFAAFLIAKRDVLRAITDTVYPGQRRVTGGDGPLAHLASGAYGWFDLHDKVGMIGGVFVNKSEASSFLLLGLPVALVVPLVGRRRAATATERLALAGVLAALILLLVHAYVGLPSFLDRVTGLDRSPGKRALIGIGLACALVVVFVGRGLVSGELERRRRVAAAFIAGTLTAAGVAITGTHLRDGGAHLGPPAIVLTSGIAAVVVGGFFFRPRWSAVAAVAIGVAVSFPVNPLYRGLGPLTDPSVLPAVRAAEATAPEGTPPGWLVTDPLSSPLLTAAGVPNASAVNFYPNDDAWSALDPTGASRDVWNRYAHTRWALVPGTGPATFDSSQDDVVEITLDPCGPELSRLGIGYIASPAPVDAPCLRAAGTTTGPRRQILYLYVRSATP